MLHKHFDLQVCFEPFSFGSGILLGNSLVRDGLQPLLGLWVDLDDHPGPSSGFALVLPVFAERALIFFIGFFMLLKKMKINIFFLLKFERTEFLDIRYRHLKITIFHSL